MFNIFLTKIFAKLTRTLCVLIFARSSFRKFNFKKFNCFVNTNVRELLTLTLQAPITQNGQTHSNNSSANCHELPLIPTGLLSRIKASLLFYVNTVLIRSSEVVHGKEVLILVIFKLWFTLSF